MGLNATSQRLTLPTRETASYAKFCGVWRIRANCAAGVPVKMFGLGIGSAGVWRPQRDSNPRYRRERAVS